MADNFGKEDGTVANGVAAEGAGDLVAEMDPADQTNGNASDEQTNTRVAEEGARDDMFVDCPDEIENSESQHNSEEKDNLPDGEPDEPESGVKVEELIAEIEYLRDMKENNVDERARIVEEYEEERAELIRELTLLSRQLKAPGENVDALQTEGVNLDMKTLGSGASLREIVNECSQNLKYVLEDRLETEEKSRELHSLLYAKDQEIDLLNARVAELYEFIQSSQSSSTLEYENLSQLYNNQLEKDKHVEEIVNRISASLFIINHQDDTMGGSLTEKISTIENSVTFLIEKYNNSFSESNQLRGILNEVGLEFNTIDEIGALVVDKINEFGRKEQDLYQNMSNLEDENRKLVEQLETQRSTIESLNVEVGRLSAEAEKEKTRCVNTKEKLSMAVTKGKALVQHRDTLKQQLAEKSSELEKCVIELQEKSTALEAAEKTKEALEAAEKFTASLQDSLAERDTILKKCGESLSESLAMEDSFSMDIEEKIRFVADEYKSLKTISLQYQKVADALLLIDFPETVASSEFDVRIHWLAESLNLSKGESASLQSEIAKIREAANEDIGRFTASLMAEILEKTYLQVQLEEMNDKYETCQGLQYELAEGKEALINEIHHLTNSVLSESQEKMRLQSEIESLRHEHEEVVQKESLASLEKNKMVRMLLEASGLGVDNHEEVHQEHSDSTIIVNNCLAKIHENTRHIEPSLDMDILENFKSLIYITDLEMRLYKLMVEENTLDRVQVSSLSGELQLKTRELNTLKDEKDALQKNLHQLEDRCALLKEKLSMAVKKGKGLVQEREAMKGVLNEKKTEIDRLTAELQQSSIKYDESQDQVAKLSLDLERISLLEAEIGAAREHSDKLELVLAERNSVLQRVIGSVEDISTPTGLTFVEPVEKVKWIAGYLSELEASKLEMDRELSGVRDEAKSLADKLSEVQMMVKSLEDSLSIAENSQSQLLDEKKELEIGRALLEEELQKEKERSSSHASMFEEFSTGKRALEDALSLAQDNISRLENEKDVAVEGRNLAEEQLLRLKEVLSDHIGKLADADKTVKALEDELSIAENSKSQLAQLEEELQKERANSSSHTSKFEEFSVSQRALEDALSIAEDNVSSFRNERDIAVENRTLAEEQVQKLKEELSGHVTKLANAERTIESLEDTLSQTQKNISVLTEENSKVHIDRADLDGEIKKFREEADSYASKFSDASLKIKSLEDTLLNNENKIVDLVEERGKAEEEILALTSKLESCMEELAKTRGSIGHQSVELAGQLSRLNLVLKDETLPSLLGQCFKRNFESLSNVDFLLTDIVEFFQEMNSSVLQNSTVMEDDSSISTSLPYIPDTDLSLEMLNDKVYTFDSENIMSCVEKINEGFHIKSKVLVDKFGGLSTHMEESIAALSRKLQMTKERAESIMKYAKELKQTLNDMETDKQRWEDTVVSMKGDFRTLLSACNDSLQGLELNVLYNVSELRSKLKFINLDDMSMDVGALEDNAAEVFATDHVNAAEKLVVATRRNQDLSKLFLDAIIKLTDTAEDMEEKLEESQFTCDEVSRERDQYKDRISMLEADLKEQQNLCREMNTKLDDYKIKDDKLRKREEELATSLAKLHDFEGSPLSAAQIKLVLDKANGIEVSDNEFALKDSYSSASVRKLFYVLDSFSESQQKVRMLSRENEELQSMTDAQILEIETLKRLVDDRMGNKKDTEKYTNKLLELESGLQSIVQKLGGSDLVHNHKVDGEIQLLPLLDKLVTATMLQSERLKSENEELGANLLGTQKVADDLSNKIKSLDTAQARSLPLEIEQETRSVGSLSAQSEISEMQDTDAVGKSNNIPHVPSAAHVRTMRKGSSSNDHLALNIDSDSERLIDKKEADDDKGHVFKSLNASGLIPRQGRAVADRVDGIWVSGSQALMGHPRGRLGLVAYCIFLHLWLLGTIL